MFSRLRREGKNLCRYLNCPVCVLSSLAVIASRVNHPSALVPPSGYNSEAAQTGQFALLAPVSSQKTTDADLDNDKALCRRLRCHIYFSKTVNARLNSGHRHATP